MTARTPHRSRGVTLVSGSVTFTGLVTTLATTMVVGVALGFAVLRGW